MITQERLKELFHYDADSGNFTKASNGGKRKAGDLCGTTNAHGYRTMKVDGSMYYAHRLAFIYMTGNQPKHFIDHINGNKSDNRWINLREATRAENSMNRGKLSNNKSGFKGVRLDKRCNRWIAQIVINKKQVVIGRYDTKQEAADAYAKEALKIHGEFCKTE